jgi:hypothetical protein
LWLFGAFYGYVKYFPRFGKLHHEKRWQPCAGKRGKKQPIRKFAMCATDKFINFGSKNSSSCGGGSGALWVMKKE